MELLAKPRFRHQSEEVCSVAPNSLVQPGSFQRTSSMFLKACSNMKGNSAGIEPKSPAEGKRHFWGCLPRISRQKRTTFPDFLWTNGPRVLRFATMPKGKHHRATPEEIDFRDEDDLYRCCGWKSTEATPSGSIVFRA